MQRHWRKLKYLKMFSIDLEKTYDRESCGRHWRIGEFVLLTFGRYVVKDMYDEVKTNMHTHGKLELWGKLRNHLVSI